MRIRHTAGVAAALVAGATLVLGSTPASAVQPTNVLTVHRAGTVDEDGTVTFTGTYRCAPDASDGPVFVSSSIIRGNLQSGINGTMATCDGRTHTWTNRGQAWGISARPGQVRMRSTLMALTTKDGWLPLPEILASNGRQVTLAEV
jgi:Family of unknown function (DUF6299)